MAEAIHFSSKLWMKMGNSSGIRTMKGKIEYLKGTERTNPNLQMENNNNEQNGWKWMDFDLNASKEE